MKQIIKKFFYYGHEKSSSEELSVYKRPKHKFYLFFIYKPINYHIEFRLFNIEFFLGLYDDLNTAIIDLWIHYLHYGRKTGHVKFEKNFYFDKKFYIENYHPELTKYHCELEHYLTEGWRNGYNPTAYFDTTFYIERYKNEYPKMQNPLEHFLKIGIFKGFIPFFIEFYSSEEQSSHEFINNIICFEINKEKDYKVPFINTTEIVPESLTVFCPLGLGDAVAIEPIFRYLKSKYVDKKLYSIFYPGQAEICKYNKNIDGIIVLNKDEDVRALIREISSKTTIVNCVLNGTVMSKGNFSFLWSNPNTNVNIFNYYEDNCILSALSECGGIPKLNVKPFFWKKESIKNVIPTEDKYIVIHCKSAEKTRTWSQKKFNNLVNFLYKEGYKVIEIGAEKIIINNGNNYFDLTNKLEFQEIYSIIEKCYIFIGVDSVFLHFANCAGVRTVCIAGPVKVRNNGLKRYFVNQKPCSGPFYEGKKIKYCYPHSNGKIDSISVEEVYKAVKALEKEN